MKEFLIKYIALLLPLCQCHQEVLLTSNSPAVLDAPITFFGRLVALSDRERIQLY